MEKIFVDTSAWFAYSLDADFQREGFEILPGS